MRKAIAASCRSRRWYGNAMPCVPAGLVFREPSDDERAFLALVVRGNEPLEDQVRSARIADYETTGWYWIESTIGKPSAHKQWNGPTLRPSASHETRGCPIETIAWTNPSGMLEAVEIITYGDDSAILPYAMFLAGERIDEIEWPYDNALSG
jgi:hypothetical protein